MRILCVCDEGVSRAPTLAAMLQYRGHETVAVGVKHSSAETRRMLAEWADRIILTDAAQAHGFPWVVGSDVEVWPIGDVYPRPFNPELHALVRHLLEHREDL